MRGPPALQSIPSTVSRGSHEKQPRAFGEGRRVPVVGEDDIGGQPPTLPVIDALLKTVFRVEAQEPRESRVSPSEFDDFCGPL